MRIYITCAILLAVAVCVMLSFVMFGTRNVTVPFVRGFHNSVFVRTTSPLNIHKPILQIDGHGCIQGHRILVADQPHLTDNGIYVVNNHALLERDGKVVNDDLVWVTHGHVHRDTMWSAVEKYGDTHESLIQFVPASRRHLGKYTYN